MKLSVLDQSPIRAGGSAADALAETRDLARLCDRLGYHRYWLAEHHNTKSFAGSAPEILIAAIAAGTQAIRVGSGGIMLTHYSPLKVAEQFRMLATLHPGRIDLGIGRAPGADPLTTRALQAGPEAWGIDAFPQTLSLLKRYLDDASGAAPHEADFPLAKVHACPRGGPGPDLWMLGSGVHSAVYAAELGLPFCHAQFINPDGAEAIGAYRARFRPSGACPRPHLAVAAFALAAETQDEASELAWTRNLWVLQLLKGEHVPFPSIETAKAYPCSDQDRVMLRAIAGRGIAGDGPAVAARLRALAGETGADELVILTITHDHAARRRSYAILAREFALQSPGSGVAEATSAAPV